jgi:hypothetical protein
MEDIDYIKDEVAQYYYGDIDVLCKSIQETYMQDKYANIDIGHARCFMNHDGYDKYGPKSNLYDLYVFYKNDDVKLSQEQGKEEAEHCESDDDKMVNIYVDVWHAEQWFIKNERVMFYRERTYRITEDTFDWFIENSSTYGISGGYHIFDELNIIDKVEYDDCWDESEEEAG